MKKRPPSVSIIRARAMRHDPTEAERRMWRLLKENFPQGRFRQQVPIRHYIADFASHRWKMVIEIDGGQHSAEKDAPRSRDIEAEGYRIVRFWNGEVLQDGEACVIQLSRLVPPDHPHPTPARQQAAKPAYPSPIEEEDGL